MTKGDPTDHALAAIASILDHPAQMRDARSELVAGDRAPEFASSAAPDGIEAAAATSDPDGYFRTGPGPFDEIRFRWTARREKSGLFYVDETVGQNSRPLTTGPMPRDAAVKYINEREREARQRFADLKAEMRTVPLAHRDGRKDVS